MNNIFGVELGRALRDQGMKAVEANSGEWKHLTRSAAEAFIAYQKVGASFSGEDIRLTLQDQGIEQPHHPNAWGAVLGGVIRRELKSGKIAIVGIRSSVDPVSHATKAIMYRKIA